MNTGCVSKNNNRTGLVAGKNVGVFLSVWSRYRTVFCFQCWTQRADELRRGGCFQRFVFVFRVSQSTSVNQLWKRELWQKRLWKWDSETRTTTVVQNEQFQKEAKMLKMWLAYCVHCQISYTSRSQTQKTTSEMVFSENSGSIGVEFLHFFCFTKKMSTETFARHACWTRSRLFCKYSSDRSFKSVFI